MISPHNAQSLNKSRGNSCWTTISCSLQENYHPIRSQKGCLIDWGAFNLTRSMWWDEMPTLSSNQGSGTIGLKFWIGCSTRIVN